MKKRILVSGILILALLTAMTPLALAVETEPDNQPDAASAIIDEQTDPLSEPAAASDEANEPAAAPDKPKDPDAVSIVIDEQPADLGTASFILNDTVYVSLRGFSLAMGAEEISWSNGIATVGAPDLSIAVARDNLYLTANDRFLFAPDGCIIQNDSMMVPVRLLARAFNAAISWSAEAQTVYVTTGTGAIESGGMFYNDDDVYWLSRIINAEARGESFVGKIAVGNVVLNRVASPQFPNSIYDVIFDRRYGIQFTPAYTGAVYNTPSEESVLAAKIALDGGNTVGDSLYFAVRSLRCWASRTRPLTMTIGNHSFYA